MMDLLELDVKPEWNGMEVMKAALSKFAENRNEDLTVFSNVPVACKAKVCYVGIDEAGRGPVLGPMVYAIFAVVSEEDKIRARVKAGQSLNKIEESPPTLLDSVKKLNDSKQVNEKVREDLFSQFSDLDYVAYGLKIISPTHISGQSYKRQKISLNDVSHNAAIELIQGFADRGIQIGRIYVDTVGPMDKYQKKLEMKFPELKFKVDKKADSKYKPVSAASICAKVTRDEVLKQWAFTGERKISIDKWGSGYPGDDVTKRFLRSNIDPIFGFPNIVRDSWSTAFDLLDKRAVKVKWETDDDDTPLPKISKFMTRKNNSLKEEGEKSVIGSVTFENPRCQFFTYRNLTQTTKLF